jgi:hypothetical protein
MSRELPFFYAKVDMDALTKISSGGKLQWKLMDPPYESNMSLPIPKQQFHVFVPISDPHLLTDTCLYKMNLNPKYIVCYDTILSIGTLCELEGKDGYWCLVTHCSECDRNNKNKNLKKISCSTPNCANNVMFRQKLKQQDCYVGL